MCSPTNLLYIAILGLLPVSEVRGAIPLAYILFDQSEYVCRYTGIALAIAGNMAIAPAILIALKKIEKYIVDSNIKPVKSLYISITSRIRRKAEKYIDRYGVPGLILFVSIPLPTTGAWSGSLAAHLLGLDIGRSIIAIEIGVAIASAIMIIGIEILNTAVSI
jgi:uncharacterized membrane protein